ncbi:MULTISPECIES: hypothetical protein [unclassified Streptomyces]|uniref:hypothetical protein n=1 Tax=unclassified Streptomyces TaxID=2593676 RepID=UPI0022563922|nr:MULTISPECIES: hypothetical protein [unclassified Streptomyces]MCX4882180.1 hypothetical protein [Streptomyces sp. NBC_00847]MCX5422225.1 hypothetical protein [Streptomyces sp. NBC_00078]
MKVITDADFQQAAELAPELLRRYLSGKGWRSERGLAGGELWERTPASEPGPPYEVLVPLTQRRDYPGRVVDILETLAVVETRTPGDILREMQLPPVDWQFLRLVPPGPSGTAPLLDLVSALTGLKDLHTAAASAAVQPQAVQPGQKPQVVKDHVASVRLDQTRVGSYVIAAHTPLPDLRSSPRQGEVPADEARQASLFEDDAFPGGGPDLRPSEPFARTVSRMLFAGVTCAHAAAEETLTRDSLDGFGRYIGAGLSANLCEALVRIAGEEQRSFSLAFDWSPERPVAQDSPPVSLTPLHVQALEAGAKDLRERAAREEGTVLHGVVTRLSGQDDRQATIYGSLLHEDASRVRSVRVELRPEDVERATAAWLDGFEVAVHGDVEPYGTGVRMRGVRRFVVRPH